MQTHLFIRNIRLVKPSMRQARQGEVSPDAVVVRFETAAAVDVDEVSSEYARVEVSSALGSRFSAPSPHRTAGGGEEKPTRRAPSYKELTPSCKAWAPSSSLTIRYLYPSHPPCVPTRRASPDRTECPAPAGRTGAGHVDLSLPPPMSNGRQGGVRKVRWGEERGRTLCT